jgi:hypothetical protein
VIDPDLYATQIMARLNELTTLDFFEGGVPDGWKPAMIPGSTQIKPYVIVSFAGLTDSHTGKGITGAADDSFNQQFSTHSVGSTVNTARKVNNMVLRKLLGFVPTNCGEITPAFFGGIGENSSLSDPSRYSAAQAYKFIANG